MKSNKFFITSVLVASLAIGSLAQAASFKDVASSHWAYNTIEWASTSSNNIAKGYPDGSFKPSQTVSEEEFLSMLIRAYGDTPDIANPARWSTKYYNLAKSLNYPVSGKQTAVITRTKVAEIVSGTQGKNYTGANAIKYMLANGLANGKTGNTVVGYKGNDSLTRAEAVAFIKNVLDNSKVDGLQTRPSTPSEPVPSTDPVVAPTPATGVTLIGDATDPTVIAQGNTVANALKGTGYGVIANSDSGRIAIKDTKTGENFFSVSANASGDLVAVFSNLATPGTTTWNSSYVSAISKALASLGLDSGSNFQAAMKAAVYDGVEKTFKSGSVTYFVTPTGFGKGLISR